MKHLTVLASVMKDFGALPKPTLALKKMSLLRFLPFKTRKRKWAMPPLCLCTRGGWYEGQDCATNPYGDNLACASAQGWTNPLTFSRVHYAGYDYNGSTGLYHTWFREYDPRLGRFLQADPLGGDASDPQSLNRFAYVLNQPSGFVDPLGLFGCPALTDSVPGSGECERGFGSIYKGQFGGSALSVLELAFRPTFGVLEIDPEFPASDNSMLYIFFGNLSALYFLHYWIPSDGSLEHFLLSCEGHKPNYGIYDDRLKNCTVGFGHLLHLGQCTQADRANYPSGMTREAALAQFRRDLSGAARQTAANLHRPYTQHQFDALVSLAFNMGMGSLRTHDVWRDITLGNLGQVPADIMSLGAGGPGMRNRRVNEARMFQTGSYATSCYAVPQ
ncbi:MAG: glycoside hydrolase family protein [Acidobacteriales bacterium]|nr:glycoside hydrolase family protein [Terriglobales bacterium]